MFADFLLKNHPRFFLIPEYFPDHGHAVSRGSGEDIGVLAAETKA